MSKVKVLAQTSIILFQSQANWNLLYTFGTGHTLFWTCIALVAYNNDKKENEAKTNSAIAMGSLGAFYLVGLNWKAGRRIRRVRLVGDCLELMNFRVKDNLMMFDKLALNQDGDYLLDGKKRYQLAPKGQFLNKELFNKLLES